MDIANLVKSDPPTLALDEAAVLTSHTEAGAWDATDAQRFIDTHPRATEQEAVAALARLERSLGQLGDEAPAGEADVVR